MWRPGLIPLIVALLIATAACSGGDSAETSTTVTATTESSATSVASTGATQATAAVPSDTAAGAGATSTTISEEGFAIPDYSIEARQVAEVGDTVVVLLAPGTYSDLDLENVVADVVERFAPIATVHVVDAQEAVDLVLAGTDALAPGDASALDEHYFARLEEGFRLVFEGPFDDLPEVILGS